MNDEKCSLSNLGLGATTMFGDYVGRLQNRDKETIEATLFIVLVLIMTSVFWSLMDIVPIAREFLALMIGFTVAACLFLLGVKVFAAIEHVCERGQKERDIRREEAR